MKSVDRGSKKEWEANMLWLLITQINLVYILTKGNQDTWNIMVQKKNEQPIGLTTHSFQINLVKKLESQDRKGWSKPSSNLSLMLFKWISLDNVPYNEAKKGTGPFFIVLYYWVLV